MGVSVCVECLIGKQRSHGRRRIHGSVEDTKLSTNKQHFERGLIKKFGKGYTAYPRRHETLC